MQIVHVTKETNVIRRIAVIFTLDLPGEAAEAPPGDGRRSLRRPHNPRRRRDVRRGQSEAAGHEEAGQSQEQQAARISRQFQVAGKGDSGGGGRCCRNGPGCSPGTGAEETEQGRRSRGTQFSRRSS